MCQWPVIEVHRGVCAVSGVHAKSRRNRIGISSTPSCGKMVSMEKVVRKFNSFEEADTANAISRNNLSPRKRVDIVFAIRERANNDASEQRFARVCRVLQLERS